MNHPTLTPSALHDRLREEPGATVIDVRTSPEYDGKRTRTIPIRRTRKS
ncbi:MAG: hypothetical protein LBK99_11625 [Opitutaceae bacterium]|nr:hypothetical protein [Opitutaceae bacterium]